MHLTERVLSFTLLGSEWVLWLLIALSVISVAIMFERGWFFDHLPYEATPIYFTEDAPNDDFDALDSAPPSEVFARYRAEVDRIRREIASVPLDHEYTDKRGRTFST